MNDNTSNTKQAYVHEYYGLPRVTRGFLRFEDVFPGSTFFIRQEISRGHKYPSRDRTLYRKATDGFYAIAQDGTGNAAVLMPEDLCVPVRSR